MDYIDTNYKYIINIDDEYEYYDIDYEYRGIKIINKYVDIIFKFHK